MKVTLITLAVICIVEFFAIILVTPLAKPKLLLRFLPKDVYEAGKNHSEPPVYKQILGFIVVIVFCAVYIGAIVFLIKDGIHRDYTYWQMAGRFFIVLYGNKAFDIIVQDQWLVQSTDFFKNYFPETKNCAGWHDRKFNNKKQLPRLICYPFVCLLIAWIAMLLK